MPEKAPKGGIRLQGHVLARVVVAVIWLVGLIVLINWGR